MAVDVRAPVPVVFADGERLSQVRLWLYCAMHFWLCCRTHYAYVSLHARRTFVDLLLEARESAQRARQNSLCKLLGGSCESVAPVCLQVLSHLAARAAAHTAVGTIVHASTAACNSAVSLTHLLVNLQRTFLQNVQQCRNVCRCCRTWWRAPRRTQQRGPSCCVRWWTLQTVPGFSCKWQTQGWACPRPQFRCYN